MEKLNLNYKTRSFPAEFRADDENGEPHICGYFAVFGSAYNIAPGLSESIDEHAFDDALSGDIRALVNHDTTLVLGRTAAHTLELKTDSHGLFGDIAINPNDSDAMNCRARVLRGDVSQCSFGFDILEESTEYRDDGMTVFHLRRVKLWEVSVCTFPAYEDTGVEARRAEVETTKARKQEEWRARMLARVKGV